MKLMIGTIIMAIGLSVQAQETNGLQTVLDRVEQVTAQRQQAIVIMDLDDTLINTRERNLRIIQDFVRLPEIAPSYPEESEKALQLQAGNIRYLLGDTLKNAGITNADFIKKASDYWLANFFTNNYCAHDKQIPGAARYLYKLIQAGAKIVYLTGRDTPRMGSGTAENLQRNFFPTAPTQALLMMKPDAKIDDLQFKKDSFAQIANMGEVVGVFENEPANLNAMMDAFPEAMGIFLDTIHSPKPDVPKQNATWVLNFILE
jgi:hypothetical protein